MAAPIVVAKGADQMALRIQKLPEKMMFRLRKFQLWHAIFIVN
jgi:flagellar biosynthesis protein FlhB